MCRNFVEGKARTINFLGDLADRFRHSGIWNVNEVIAK